MSTLSTCGVRVCSAVQYKDVLKLGICTSSYLGLIFNHLGLIKLTTKQLLKANFEKVKQQYWYDTGRKSPKNLLQDIDFHSISAISLTF